MAQQRPYPITLDERRLSTQLSRSRCVPRAAGMGHQERFSPQKLNAGCGLTKETFAGLSHNEEDTPIPAIRGAFCETDAQ
jgi:hypothetical protein